MNTKKPLWKSKLYQMIFNTDTKSGKTLDTIIMILILLSILCVLLESIPWIRLDYSHLFNIIEWVFTVLFSLEYILRISCVEKPSKYIFSFMGLIDIIAILPSYLGLFIGSGQSLIFMRTIRLFRILRILKLRRYLQAAKSLERSILLNLPKIIVFLSSLVVLILILGSLMYLIEGEENGFSSIPHSMYWAIVTVTTVGYGDLVPKTNLGQAISSLVMILGYAIIAVPTGIITAGIVTNHDVKGNLICKKCNHDEQSSIASFCSCCGNSLLD
jgi:voltage-gated potassium channel